MRLPVSAFIGVKMPELLSIKANAALRYGMVHLLSGRLPLYVVNEYPKSGGTWLGQMLASAFGLPFPRNRFPACKPSVIHGHYLSPWGMRNVVVVWRDGRDVIVSLYHHCLFKNERSNGLLVDIVRKDLPFKDYENVRENLPTFIEYCFTRQRYPRFPRFSWTDFVQHWHGYPGVIYTRYEDLRQNVISELQRMVFALTEVQLEYARAAEIAHAFSFASQAGRQPGEENKNSFMRKGVVGDWRNHFSREAGELFDRYAGDALMLLGYEQDRSWVKTNEGNPGHVSGATQK